MVSSGTVNGDLNSLKAASTNYTSEIDGLASNWKGASYDGLNSKADAFISEYMGTLEGEMSSFATACDLYEKYKTAKTNLQTAQSNYNTAVSNNDSSAASTYSNQMGTYKAEMNTLKTQIDASLQAAKATSLTATSNSASADTSTGASSTDTSSTETTTVTGNLVLNGNVIDTSSPVGTGTKYNLTDDELAYLAYVAKREQGSVGGAKLELSLMVNLYEKHKSKFSSVVDYVQNSGWFSSRSTREYNYPGDDYVAAAREVVAEGNHYLPSNVVEHDCLSDITSISSGSTKNRSDYIPGETIIKNRYGATYKFVGFAPNGGDPFGYLV